MRARVGRPKRGPPPAPPGAGREAGAEITGAGRRRLDHVVQLRGEVDVELVDAQVGNWEDGEDRDGEIEILVLPLVIRLHIRERDVLDRAYGAVRRRRIEPDLLDELNAGLRRVGLGLNGLNKGSADQI